MELAQDHVQWWVLVLPVMEPLGFATTITDSAISELTLYYTLTLGPHNC
jgi:hypothetical protein